MLEQVFNAQLELLTIGFTRIGPLLSSTSQGPLFW